VNTLEFNIGLKKIGAYQSGADAFVFSGANRWNHADTDAGFHLPFWEGLTMGRAYCYDSTYTRVPTSGQYMALDLAARAFDNCGGYGAARIECVNFGLGSFIVSGHFPVLLADYLFAPGDPDGPVLTKLFSTWFSFYKKWRPLLATDLFLHVAPVTSRTLEVTLHSRRNCRGGGEACMIIGLVNPTSFPMKQNVPVSLYYSGVKVGATVTVLDITPTKSGREAPAASFVVGAQGGLYDILVPVTVGPRSFQALLVAVK